MTYYCRLIFKNFSSEQVDVFLQNCIKYEWETIASFNVIEGENRIIGTEVDLFDEKLEKKFSFELTPAEDADKYERITLAFCELSMIFRRWEEEMKTQNQRRRNALTVILTSISRNIAPQRFELQNIFNVKQFSMGSIYQKHYFANTLRQTAPASEGHKVAFEKYLTEHRDIEPTGNNMLAIFEHDRDSLVLAFPDFFATKSIQTEEGVKESIKTGNRIVELKVKYSSIRRIIVSLDYNNKDRISATFIIQYRYPPMIFIWDEFKGKEKTNFRNGKRWLSWSGRYVEAAFARASCISFEAMEIDGRVLMDCLDRLRKNIDSPIEFRFLQPYMAHVDGQKKFTINPMHYWEINFFQELEKDAYFARLRDPKYFALVYAVEALISYGGELYDHFFRPPHGCFKIFMKKILYSYDQELKRDPEAKFTKTVAVLENMLQQMHGVSDVPWPSEFFDIMFQKTNVRMVAELSEELEKEGYMRVRKLIVTPTRKLYVNPELIMGNRSLRKKRAENMLRVVFRDDDSNKVSNLPKALIERTVKNILKESLYVGLRQFSYLCSSNSQMRDHGTYFLAGDPKSVAFFRLQCGRFKFTSIPKVMSRIGQCFTQACELGIVLEREAYSEIFDYQLGANSNGESYTFSDGCGMISPDYCKKIVEDLKLGNCLPCCFQIRFRGYKGIVCMNTLFDIVKKYADERGLPLTGDSKIVEMASIEGEEEKQAESENINEEDKAVVPSSSSTIPWYRQSLIFRESQKKFYGPKSKHLEIVKISCPISVSMNKPLINILDQVSEMHGPEAHKRMCNRIHDLLEDHVDSAISSLYDETAASLTLNEFPKYIPYHRLNDFHLTEEPFLRSLLRSSALVSLHKLIEKMQIRVPVSQGRMMFGVVDETGYLQYGQVFFQYHVNATVKYPGPHSLKVVHEGPVLVTKNPSVVAGDVRMFEAVDIPCLHDLVDVIVFPRHGPRPHPDEMAGSDLDGDEYSIFWDPELFLDRTEPAFDFTATKQNVKLDEEEIKANLTDHMIDFFTKYVSQDAIGKIANSHLANSDLYGINSEHCFSIAKKHNQAVDFPKSGEVPDPLRKKWENGQPPETVERFPNYMLKNNTASYKSIRLLGDLFSRVTEVKEIIRVEELAECNQEIKLDESVLLEGDSEFQEAANKSYVEYGSMIQSLCEDYGIQKEGQLFSGRFTALKKQVNLQNDNDMSYFNVQHMIEERLALIYAKFRSLFFEEFDGIEANTVDDDNYMYNGIRETFRRICTNPSKQLQHKASAYYRIAYTDQKYLSFAWLVADILAYNRQEYLKIHVQKFTLCPLFDRLSELIEEACSSKTLKKEMDDLKKLIEKTVASGESNEKMELYVAEICQRYIGLPELLLFIRKWIQKHNVKNIDAKTLDSLFIAYGLGELQKSTGGWLICSSLIKGEFTIVDLKIQIGGLGKRFWNFVRYLRTRSFGFSGKVPLRPVCQMELSEAQCQSLYYMAMDTFFTIATNRRFECLPIESENGISTVKRVFEGLTIAIELPKSCPNYEKLLTTVSKKSGCARISIRKKPARLNAQSDLISIKPVGTFVAVQKLLSILEVRPRVNETDLQKRSEMIFQEVYKRLLFYSNPENSIDDPFIDSDE